ncbi:hypothetical protein JL721_6934 [Aureococcus anophagefferens]|nr:hypothetical protein JL721_6934 [Aureococcus anophagefferens]
MAAEPPGSGACWDGVVRLIVVGDAGSGKSAVIESFSAHLRGEPPPPRRASLEAARPVEGRDAFAPCAPGDVGFDALGRRVCLLEIPGALAAPAGGDAFLALTEMPRDQGRTRVIQRRFNRSTPLPAGAGSSAQRPRPRPAPRLVPVPPGSASADAAP